MNMPRILIDPTRVRNGARGDAFRKDLVAALMSLEELEDWFRTRTGVDTRHASVAATAGPGDKEDKDPDADDEITDDEDEDDDEFDDDDADDEDGGDDADEEKDDKEDA